MERYAKKGDFSISIMEFSHKAKQSRDIVVWTNSHHPDHKERIDQMFGEIIKMKNTHAVPDDMTQYNAANNDSNEQTHHYEHVSSIIISDADYARFVPEELDSSLPDRVRFRKDNKVVASVS